MIKNTKENKKIPYFSIMLLLVLAIYILRVVFLPFGTISATARQIDVENTGSDSDIVWPEAKQATLAIKDYGIIETHGEQESTPIASIAKTILALCVMNEKPMGPGEDGETITITQNDLDLYNEQYSQNGSVVPVALGEELTQYEALQALLLPSGNNIADTMAIWAFGSETGYLSYANDFLSDLGLKNTHVNDASGFSDQTVSSSDDLIIIGQMVMDDQVLKEIVNQYEATLPVAGEVYNVNSLLGSNNIIGIKTGNTDEAGGCLLFAVEQNIGDEPQIIIGSILGAADLSSVLTETTSFIESNFSRFKSKEIVSSDLIIGTYDVKWSDEVNIVSSEDIEFPIIGEQDVKTEVSLDEITEAKSSGDQVGTIKVIFGEIEKTYPLVLASDIPEPSLGWKLTHPF